MCIRDRIPFDPPLSDLTGRRVLVTAGRRDPICPPDLTQALADHLGAQGAAVSLHWHGGGHEIAPSEWQAVEAFLR